jgi:hypothetical protein
MGRGVSLRGSRRNRTFVLSRHLFDGHHPLWHGNAARRVAPGSAAFSLAIGGTSAIIDANVDSGPVFPTGTVSGSNIHFDITAGGYEGNIRRHHQAYVGRGYVLTKRTGTVYSVLWTGWTMDPARPALTASGGFFRS